MALSDFVWANGQLACAGQGPAQDAVLKARLQQTLACKPQADVWILEMHSSRMWWLEFAEGVSSAQQCTAMPQAGDLNEGCTPVDDVQPLTQCQTAAVILLPVMNVAHIGLCM